MSAGSGGDEQSSADVQADVNLPTWPVFLCYRQTDGRPTSEWLHQRLHERRITDATEALAVLDVYLDRRAPAIENWRELHLPALQRARSLIVVLTPGLYPELGREDWVHRELDWWLENRRTAPLLVDTTGEERWIPEKIKKRWPNAQRVEVKLAEWSGLPADDAAHRAEAELERLLAGIRLSEQKLTFEDLERFQRLARRLKAALLAATLGLLAASITSVIAYQSLEVAKQRAKEAREALVVAREATQRAEQREQETRAALDDMSSVVIEDALARQTIPSPETQAYLGRCLELYQSFVRSAGDTRENRVNLGRAQIRVSKIHRILGDQERAENGLDFTIPQLKLLHEQHPGDSDVLRTYAEALDERTALRPLGGKSQQDVDELELAIGLQQQAGDSRADRLTLVKYCRACGVRNERHGNRTKSLENYSRAVEILDELKFADAGDPEVLFELALLNRASGDLYSERVERDEPYDLEEALRFYDEAVRDLETLIAVAPLVVNYRLELARTYNNRALARRKAGDLAGVRHDDAAAAERFEGLAIEFGSVPEYRRDSAINRFNAALVATDLGELDQAEQMFLSAFTVQERLVQLSPTDAKRRLALATYYARYGSFVRKHRLTEDSFQWFDKALLETEALLAQGAEVQRARDLSRDAHWDRAIALHVLGCYDESVENWNMAICFDDKGFGEILRMRRALAEGEHVAATEAANRRADDNADDGDTLFNCGCIFVLASQLTDDAAVRAEYQKRALALLRQSVEAGSTFTIHLHEWKELLVMHGNEEFERLVAESEQLERPWEPQSLSP